MNRYISTLQIFAIVLVVVGHSTLGAPSEPFYFTWIYSFHMPLFIFLSGYLFRYAYTKKNIHLDEIPILGMKGIVLKKTKRLLLPYIAISSLAFIPKALLSSLALRPVDFSFSGYLHQLIYPCDNVILFFWFLPTLFIIFLIMAFIFKLPLFKDNIKSYIILLILTLIISCYNPFQSLQILNIGGVFHYIFYFILGMFASYLNLMESDNKNLYQIFLFTFLLSVLLLLMPSFSFKSILTSINGIILSVCLSKIYVRNNCHYIDFLYGSSYTIYLFSWFPQTFSQQVLLHFNVPYYICNFLAVVTGLFIPFLIYKFALVLKKYKKLSWLSVFMGI